MSRRNENDNLRSRLMIWNISMEHLEKLTERDPPVGFFSSMEKEIFASEHDTPPPSDGGYVDEGSSTVGRG